MKLHLLYERSVHVLASSLAMVAQRLPFLKNLSPVLGSAGSVKFAAPLALNYVGIQALSGQSGAPATLSGVNGSPNPASGAVGEEFVWSFQVSSGTIRSFKVETWRDDDFVEGLPQGLSTFLPPSSRFGYIGGTPEEAGFYVIAITAFDEPDYQGYSSEIYYLTLDIDGPLTLFDEFNALFWSGANLTNPAIVGANADPDGDGIENVLEFVLNLDPTRRGVMPGTFGPDPADDSMLRYEIPLNELAADVTVIFEESTSGNPNDWTPVPIEQFVRTNTEIVLTTSRGPGKKLYRLKVTL
jgi:hypothetical protein